MLLKFEIGGTLEVTCDRCNNNLPFELWDEFNITVKMVVPTAGSLLLIFTLINKTGGKINCLQVQFFPCLFGQTIDDQVIGVIDPFF